MVDAWVSAVPETHFNHVLHVNLGIPNRQVTPMTIFLFYPFPLQHVSQTCMLRIQRNYTADAISLNLLLPPNIKLNPHPNAVPLELYSISIEKFLMQLFISLLETIVHIYLESI